jgi:hypothetical protein
MKFGRTGLLALATLGAPLMSAAWAQESPRYYFEGDMVRAAQGSPKGAPCVLTSQFHRGEIALFRVRVIDAKTGKPVDGANLKKLEIHLSNGESAPMSYHQHTPKDPTDWFWSGGWIITDKVPTGSLTYKVVATDMDGKEYSWSPFKVAPSQLTVLEN